MSSHEAPAQVADFFSTIEEAGIADIAAEVGIIPDSGSAISPPRASSLPPLDGSVQPSYLTSHGGGSSSNGAGSSIMPGPGSANPPAPPAPRSPPLLLHLPARSPQCLYLSYPRNRAIVEGGSSYVHMSYSGPQVPDGLASTLIAAGEPAAKKKRMQRTHGGKAGDKVLAAPPPPAALLLPPNLPPNPPPDPPPSPPPNPLLTFLLTRILTLLLHSLSPPPRPHPHTTTLGLPPPPALP